MPRGVSIRRQHRQGKARLRRGAGNLIDAGAPWRKSDPGTVFVSSVPMVVVVPENQDDVWMSNEGRSSESGDFGSTQYITWHNIQDYGQRMQINSKIMPLVR
jgi:hypothetical protein